MPFTNLLRRAHQLDRLLACQRCSQPLSAHDSLGWYCPACGPDPRPHDELKAVFEELFDYQLGLGLGPVELRCEGEGCACGR